MVLKFDVYFKVLPEVKVFFLILGLHFSLFIIDIRNEQNNIFLIKKDFCTSEMRSTKSARMTKI